MQRPKERDRGEIERKKRARERQRRRSCDIIWSFKRNLVYNKTMRGWSRCLVSLTRRWWYHSTTIKQKHIRITEQYIRHFWLAVWLNLLIIHIISNMHKCIPGCWGESWDRVGIPIFLYPPNANSEESYETLSTCSMCIARLKGTLTLSLQYWHRSLPPMNSVTSFQSFWKSTA